MTGMSSESCSAFILAGGAATLAAILASTGDFILLAHGAARVAGDRTIDDPVLIAGHYLGVLAIPFYAAGYWLVSRLLDRERLAARIVFPLGCYLAAVGTVIHGVTAVLIETNLEAIGGGDILSVPHADYLIPLWLVLLLPALVVSLIYCGLVLAGSSVLPRWMGLVNPAGLTIVIVAMSAPFPDLAAYLVPASANLVHVVFFAMLTVMVALNRSRNGSDR
jgi:hypothetical protein